MLTACRSVVKLIATLFNRYQPVLICSACGEFDANYVSHCLLCCHADSGVRHKMLAGFLRKFGANVYSCLAKLTYDSLLDVLLGNFEIMADVLTVSQKDDFYCYVARFVHIQTVCLQSRSFYLTA